MRVGGRRRLLAFVSGSLLGLMVAAALISVAAVVGWRIGFDHPVLLPGDDPINVLLTFLSGVAGALVGAVLAVALLALAVLALMGPLSRTAGDQRESHLESVVEVEVRPNGGSGV